MRVAIIGAGISGLTLAYNLSRAGHTIEVFEKSGYPGGLASGFKDEHWEWSLEHHYHHLFKSDTAIRALASDINFPIDYYDPATSIWSNLGMHRFDGPKEILSYPDLSLLSKLRLGFSAMFLKVWPWWSMLESLTAEEWIVRYMGREAAEKIWLPLLYGKFGKDAGLVSAVWFWARIHARTRSLGYFRGGFQTFVDHFASYLLDRGVTFHYNSDLVRVKKEEKIFRLSSSKKKHNEVFDQVVVAAPAAVLLQLVSELSKEDILTGQQPQSLGAMTLVLSLKHQFLTDGTYWLNVNKPAPFLAVVEHTNMISTRHYNNEHLIYVGKYLRSSDTLFGADVDILLKYYLPTLRQINPNLKLSSIRKKWLFKTPYAQPLYTCDYSKHLPRSSTPISGLWWISMQHVYPWDRGTNYAVEWAHALTPKILSNE